MFFGCFFVKRVLPLLEEALLESSATPAADVELLKALYGTLRAARLFWEKLSSKLKEWGFEMNKYDPCVPNKIVNRHTDDCGMECR